MIIFYFLGFASLFLVLGIAVGRRMSDASYTVDRMTDARLAQDRMNGWSL